MLWLLLDLHINILFLSRYYRYASLPLRSSNGICLVKSLVATLHMEGHSSIVAFNSINLIALALIRDSRTKLLTAKSTILHTVLISPWVIHIVIKMSFGLECTVKYDLLSKCLLIQSFIFLRCVLLQGTNVATKRSICVQNLFLRVF